MAHTIVIFGASGDLTARKLVPALYRLHQAERLPVDTRILGVSRSRFDDQQWREELTRTSGGFLASEEKFQAESWRAFLQQVFYQAGDVTQAADVAAVGHRLDELEQGQAASRIYYLSIAPQLYAVAVEHLGQAGLAHQGHGARRLVIEKPFGTDLSSARALNDRIHAVFEEKQIYRIDHYLGKETVQNLLVLRFANTIFEPIWNRNYIDHVQITVAEEVVVGRRAAYYDGSGILRDMFQNHLLQLMTITAMEAPARFEADLVRDEKVKVLRAVRPIADQDVARDTLRGRYQGYAQEEGVAPHSQTATFAILKLGVDNWRWNGVPFYLRSGKAMSCRTTQIVIQFREPPHMMFTSRSGGSLEANRLVIQIQPAEGIQLHFQTKVPDAGMNLRLTDLDFRFQREFRGVMPEAYERLLLDAIQGDASLFARSDEVELAWSIIDPILSAWHTAAAPPLLEYPPSRWGPEEAAAWMQQQRRQWFDVCPVLR